MSTEKDAMALAVLDRDAKDAQTLRGFVNGEGTEVVARQESDAARAHLASRIAELEQALTFARQARDVAMHEMQQSDQRATRAEAELAAVRAAGLRVTTAFRALGVATIYREASAKQECEAAMLALDAAIDAARGEGG